MDTIDTTLVYNKDIVDRTIVNITDNEYIYLYDMLIEPSLDKMGGINRIVADCQAKFDIATKEITERIRTLTEQIQTQESRLASATSTLDDIRNRQKLLPQIAQKIKAFMAFFPANIQHDIEEMPELFDYIDALLQRLKKQTGFFQRLSFNKTANQIVQLHSEITKLMEQAEIDNINKISISDTSQKATVTNITEDLAQKRDTLAKAQAEFDESRTEHTNIMHQHISAWLQIYGDGHASRTEMRKRIPDMLNMHNLSEPVSFFQIVQGVSEEQLETLLTHAGLSVGYGEGQYIVRKIKSILGVQALELITPFYSKEGAQKNIKALTQYLAAHNVEFLGVISPATYDQINPRPTTKNDHGLFLLRQKLEKGYIDVADFERKYPGNKYLFRGQTFMTADPKSSYATVTWRPGRTGIAYASDTASKAIKYATNNGLNEIAGQTMDFESIRHKLDGYVVGMVTVFESSLHNRMVPDLDLENISSKKGWTYRRHPVQETCVNPQDNKIVARYVIVGEKMLQVDENDDKWKLILDYFAPNLETTHIFGPNKRHVNMDNQQVHGRMFVERINSISNPPKTYDIPDTIMKNLGYSADDLSQQFTAAKKHIAESITTPDTLNTNTTQSTHDL